ncbi:methyltransferase domain-containing protein [Nonomuraea sp. NN258]|uniref:class I SAM-dependent methyltransferase n=1 Tax=Nonomuraea antri TaxID=2730852 RepID=UPI00156A1B68|nr:methyltransferase domain-containing protein [Nonomuraea antri]NRQ38778.1 methyltransferase domain-containing protein [Nonomuraea antri]
MPQTYWNHNVHYQKLVLRLLPEGCARALDVGCGDGLLAARLAAAVPGVTAVDRSPEAIKLAGRRHGGVPNVTFVEGDFLDADLLPEGGHDFVSAVAVVHHADFGAAAAALRRLLAPGGRLVVIGLAKDTSPRDWVHRLAGQAVSRVLAPFHGGKRGPGDGVFAVNPVMPWAETARAAARELPGCRFRRLLLRRYLLVWDKPR